MRTLIWVFCILQMGCATMLQNGPARIMVNSEPAGAFVSLNGMPVGLTPTTIHVNRHDDCIVDIKKAGFAPVHLERTKVFSGWFIGSVIGFGIIGAGVDLATSNQGHHPEDPIYVTLMPTSEVKPQ